MIVDLERDDERKFVTRQVTYIKRQSSSLWEVRFCNSQRIFSYNTARLLCMTGPEAIDLKGKGVYIDKVRVSGIAELLKFSDGTHTFFRAIYEGGGAKDFCGNEIYVTRTPIDKTGGSTWSYLNKLAEETGLLTEDGKNTLSMQYSQVDLYRDNVPLSQYLGDSTRLARRRLYDNVYYPFGCNASQKKAVENALTHQVSIIQGPPGTGKTQTILNIIANLIVHGKTVLVVSNNNSAVDNVAEKMADEGLGFLVAKLGSSENRKEFISSQQDIPDIRDWHSREASHLSRKVKDILGKMSGCFGPKEQLARLKGDYDALSTEAEYHRMLWDVRPEYRWLEKKDPKQLMRFRLLYEMASENGRRPGILFRMEWTARIGFRVNRLLDAEPNTVIRAVESVYYVSKKKVMERKIRELESILESVDMPQLAKDLRSVSMEYIRHKISEKYRGHERKRFSDFQIRNRSGEFLQEYPIVLSTTYSARSCISSDMVFDYVIMDEASQVDIKTGALALSCATNAVIVGDDKQLPNVISNGEKLALDAIMSTYKVDEKYDAATHSFLKSCLEAFKDAPVTLLREHYRCHPKIIGFCNQRFYGGELIPMTEDHGEPDVLRVVRTAPGNHARGHFNQREIDTIVKEVMPVYCNQGSIGIITPYRTQADEINAALKKDIASTVHKFQGRECDTIILSTVDNSPTEFSDDPNLLNVAISRAKSHLCVVTNGNGIPEDSNLGQLISYIQYNNFEISDSNIHSRFDLLYGQYTKERLEFEATHPKKSEHLSENIIYYALKDAIELLSMKNIDIKINYPLIEFITDWSILEPEEKAFVYSQLSHMDLLIINTLTKMAILAIEVDGWKYHRKSEVQRARDAIKDSVLSKISLPLHRISTTDTVTVSSLAEMISKIICAQPAGVIQQDCQ